MTLRPTRKDAPALGEPPASAARGDFRRHPDLVKRREADAERDRELEAFNERAKGRWKMYVLGAVIFFPLATWFFTPAGFSSLWFQILVSAVYGSFVAFVRPTGGMAVLSTLLAGLTIQAYTGHAAPSFGLLMSLIFYGFIGALIGMGERSRVMDGR